MPHQNVPDLIDEQITADLNGRGVIGGLAGHARELAAGPVAMAAAVRINESLKDGGTVVISTGFSIPPKNVQETDGPAGAAALARIFGLLYGCNSLIVTEEESVGIVEAALNGAGQDLVNLEKFGKGRQKGVATVIGFPIELRKGEIEAKRIIRKYNPSLVLAIEKAGRNSKGEYHTMRGLNVSLIHSKIEPLIGEAEKAGILTVAIGDGGNEIGMGNLKKTVEKIVPHARECECGCGGGIAADSKVDMIVAATVSNWGGYGVEACLAFLSGKPELMHTMDSEEAMIEMMVEAGAIDGITGLNVPSVDGLPMGVQLSMVEKLRKLIEK